MLWQRATPAEVKIVLGSHIALPKGRQIPIRADGTHPHSPERRPPRAASDFERTAPRRAATRDREERGAGGLEGSDRARAHAGQSHLAAGCFRGHHRHHAGRTNICAASRRIFDYAILVLHRGRRPVSCAGSSAFDLVLGGIAATAAYCLIALGTLSRWSIWLPGILPLSAIWARDLFCVVLPEKKRTPPIGIPPPIA